MQFKRVKKDAFETLQLETGIILSKFDFTGATPVAEEDILFVTTGGISASYVQTVGDMASDVDNAPNNLLDFAFVESDEATLSTTAINASAEAIQRAIGACDVTEESNGLTKVTPRDVYKAEDFKDLYFASDLANGDIQVIVLKNSLSSAGFTFQSTKGGKGTSAVSFKAYRSLETQDEVPFEVYIGKITPTTP